MRRRALSLVEVVFAVVILGLAVPPLLVQVGAGTQQQQAALIQTNLVQIASERLNDILADHTNPLRGYTYLIDASYLLNNAPRGLTGYTLRTELREVSGTDYLSVQAGSGIKRLRITASGPQNQTLVVESFVSDTPGAVAGP